MYFRSRKKSAQDISISDPIDTDKEGNSITLMDIVAEEDHIIDDLDLKIKAEKLYRFTESVLEPRERRLIHMRYGLGGKEPCTQREAAKVLGISRSYVSRIEKKALEKLKAAFLSSEHSHIDGNGNMG